MPYRLYNIIFLHIYIYHPSPSYDIVVSILFIRIPIIWARIIFYSQYLVCKFLFFADKEGKFISITNRYIIDMHEHINYKIEINRKSR
jgi:hypothetical protein